MSQVSANTGTSTGAAAAAIEGRVAFIPSCWHRDIVDQSRIAFTAHLDEASSGRYAVDCFEVPGALELPLQGLNAVRAVGTRPRSAGRAPSSP